MPCKFFTDGGCGGCCNFSRSTNIALVAGVLQITIPSTPIRNHQKVCVCLAQAIPNTITVNTTVAVVVGASIFILVDKCGNNIYADQLRSRKVLHLCAATDGPRFVTDTCNLCKTAHGFAILPTVIVDVAEV